MHKSLHDTFIPPPPLEPRKAMPMNDRCWCGSGKKWKKCHRDREKQIPDPIGKLLAQQRDEMTKGYCLHPEASQTNCSSNIIRAHTVQRKGGLSAIAENGHVISPKKGFEDIFKHDGVIIPRKLGLKSAATFTGFCSIHDDQMFKPIEQKPLILDQQAAFLLSFRAISYEYFTKEAVLRSIDLHRAMDKGQPFEMQCVIQQHLHLSREGMKRGMRDLKRWKTEYDNAYIEKNYDNFSFYGVRFSGMIPVVACGAFHPEYDFDGNRLQIISRGESTFEHICLNLSVVGEKSIAVLGWSGEPDGPAEKFFDSFRKLGNQRKANTVIYLACEHLENIYFQPSWWQSLSGAVKNDLDSRFKSGIGLPWAERTSDSLSNFKYFLSTLDVEHELNS